MRIVLQSRRGNNKFPVNVSTYFQRCAQVNDVARTSNVYVNVKVYKVKQRRINLVYFNIDMKHLK